MKKWVFALCGAALLTAAPITASAAKKTEEVVVETKTETVTWKPMSDNTAAQTTVPTITPDKAVTKKKEVKKKKVTKKTTTKKKSSKKK